MFRADHKLIKVAFFVDGDEADQRARLLRDHDRGIRHQFAAPALAPPGHARGEINFGIGLLPGPLPQCDYRVFVLGAIGTELKRCGAYRSVSFSSMRQVRLLASSFAAVSGGWNLAKTAPTSRRRRPPR